MQKKICIYGKGGIGKSTIVANLAAAMSLMGFKIAVVGCDPKADSTRNLVGKRIPTVLDIKHEKLDVPLYQCGFQGIVCIESGGPIPATGCAGRGITVALQSIKEQHLLDNMDIVIYDVLGDVVCGGFATPLRENIADDVYIVTTSDYMSLYAANNICRGIERYASTKTVRMAGFILNERSSMCNYDMVSELANKIGTEIIGKIPMSSLISKAELMRKTVVEQYPDSSVANDFKRLAMNIISNKKRVIPNSVTDDEVEELCIKHLKTY